MFEGSFDNLDPSETIIIQSLISRKLNKPSYCKSLE